MRISAKPYFSNRVSSRILTKKLQCDATSCESGVNRAKGKRSLVFRRRRKTVQMIGEIGKIFTNNVRTRNPLETIVRCTNTEFEKITICPDNL